MSRASEVDSVASSAGQYLQLAGQRLAAARGDMDRIISMGKKMAKPLLAGGNLFISPVAPWWCSEVGGRAGGMMGLERSHGATPGKGDVAAFTLPPQAELSEKAAEALSRLTDSPAELYAVAGDEALAALGLTDRVGGATGGVDTTAGFGRFGAFDPLCPVWPLDTILRGWLAQGEMIAACIRAGRMPVMYMSVWLEGAFVRNASFRRSEPLVEPFDQPFFHSDRYVPPLDAGRVGNEFLEAIEAIHAGLVSQVDRVVRGGRMIADALKAGRRVRAVLVGHSYPRILEVDFDAPAGKFPIEWGRSMSHLPKAVPADFGEGDLLLHLGYGPVEPVEVKTILSRGIRIIHTTPYGRRPGLPELDDPNFLWLDLPWRPADATVDVPGYSVRILPASSTVQTIAFYAMLAEAAAAMDWR